MRYYVMAIQYNMVASAENRTVPKAFNTLDEAVAEFHGQLGSDMKNSTLGWSLCLVVDSNGFIHRKEKWTRPAEVEVTE